MDNVVTFTTLLERKLSHEHIALALNAIDEAGLQAPPSIELFDIVMYARMVMRALQSCALKAPTESECRELFEDFVVRAVNRAPGIGDAATH